ncbi:MAG: tetratricopeptide repeat protein [Ignavibacteria bacterium]|nr:tetratricopeptide repeat protein [Ignavibacteria bacterium]
MNHDEFTQLITEAEVALDKWHFDEADALGALILQATDVAENKEGYSDTDVLLQRLQAFQLRGSSQGSIGNYHQALEYFLAALELSNQTGDMPGRANALGCIGLVYWNFSDYSRALDYLYKALEIDEQLQRKKDIAKHLGHIALIYANLPDYKRSLEYYNRALSIDLEINNMDGVIRHYCNLGNLHQTLGELSTALEYYYKAIDIEQMKGHLSIITDSWANIGSIYFLQSDYTRALECYRKTLEMYRQVGNKVYEATTLGQFGLIYSHPEFEGYNLDVAENYYQQALTMFEEFGTKKESYEIHKALSGIYSAREQWDKYAVHINKYHLLEKEVHSDEAQRLAHQLDYERTLADKELQRVKAVYEAEQAQSQSEIYRLKNEKLATALEQVRLLNSSLSAAIAEKNEILGIVSHDLKNPLNSILLIAKMMNAGSLSETEIQEYIADILTSAERMFKLITSLLDMNAIDQGHVVFDLQPVDANANIMAVVGQYFTIAAQKNISIHSTFTASTPMLADENIIVNVAENLISNAVKYSPFNKNIYVNVSNTSDSTVRFSVRDEGPGLSAEDMTKLFGKFTRLSAQPTGGEHSTGLGLSIVKKLVEAMNGKVWCESKPGHGAEFIVELPAYIG